MAKKQKSKATPAPDKFPTVEAGVITLTFSKQELITLAEFLDMTANTFATLAVQAQQQTNDETTAILQARYKLSTIYAEKFAKCAAIGEPESRDVH